MGLLGMSYRGDVLEVVVCPTTVADEYCKTTPLKIVTFAPGAAPTERAIARDAIHCSGYCELGAAFRRDGEKTWRFLLVDYSQDGLAWIDVAEDGTYVALPKDVSPSRGTLDRTYFGVITETYRAPLVLLRDGRLEQATTSVPASTHLMIDARRARVVTSASAYVEGPPPAMEHHVGTHVFRTAHVYSTEGDAPDAGTPGYHDERLSIVDATDPAHPRQTFPARLHDCTELAFESVFFPQKDGGFILIAPSGCYVTLDRDLKRTDPHGVLSHLRMRGSMYLDWNEPSHAWKLAFVLFGLPLAFVVAFAVQRLRRTSLAPHLVVAMWTYAAVAAFMLWFHLWPLMR